MIAKLVDWMIPITCIVCGFQSKKEICPGCFAELPWLIRPCLTCCNELPMGSEVQQCGGCLIDPPIFARVVIPFHYQSPLSSLITKLKFQKKLMYAHPFGAVLAEHIRKTYSEWNSKLPERIFPVPLFNGRLRERGYNQALEIAKPIKTMLNIPIDYLSIKRSRATAPQTLVQAHERAMNVKNAFQIVKEINLKHVVLVDDVVTTFSTLSEVAKVLRKQGVERIDAWCVAKASRSTF